MKLLLKLRNIAKNLNTPRQIILDHLKKPGYKNNFEI